MGARLVEGNGFTSGDRNMLRAVAGYGGTAVTAGEVSRSLGISRQAASAQAAMLARCGLLTMQVLPAGRYYYRVTAAGLAELEAHKTALLLVEVDDRLAGDILHYLSPEFINGIVSVTDHVGCCCKNCPWQGDHG